MAIDRVVGAIPVPLMSVRKVDCKCCGGSGKTTICPRCNNTGFESVSIKGGGIAATDCRNGWPARTDII